MSSAKNRAISVRVSSVAVLRDNDGHGYPFLEFRVGEIRKHQLMNLKVSAFLFTHKGEKLFHRQGLELDPSEGVFLAVPTEVRHIVNETSAFWNFLRRDGGASLQSFDCSVCGDSFESRANLTKHMTHLTEAGGDVRHMEALASLKSLVTPSLQNLSSVIKSTSEYWEVILMVEGMEPITGSPIQVRHSFLASDLRIGARFHKCWSIEISETNKRVIVDFDQFDQVTSEESI